MVRKVGFFGALLLLVPMAASAQVIIGNLPQNNDGTQSAGVNDQRQKAHRFTMGADSFFAGDLTLRLRNYDAFDEAIVELRDFSGSNTTPGNNVLLTFSAPNPGGSDIMNYTFTPDAFFQLSANTTYWIVVRGVGGGSFDWMASSPGITPTGEATWNSTSFTSNGGSSWSNSSILNSFEFQAGIPAPGALALLGLAGLASRRRRRG